MNSTFHFVVFTFKSHFISQREKMARLLLNILVTVFLILFASHSGESSSQQRYLRSVPKLATEKFLKVRVIEKSSKC